MKTGIDFIRTNTVIKLFALFALVLLPGCGQSCDTHVGGICVVHSGTWADYTNIDHSLDLTEQAWNSRFSQVNLRDLASKYGLTIIYENDDDFGYDGLSGYFSWRKKELSSPEIHIANRSRYDSNNVCMTGFVLGHELLHFLVFTVGDNQDGHDDTDIWIDGAGKSRYAMTAEFDIYDNMALFCGIK